MTRMLAVEYDRFGGPDVCQLREVKRPRPRGGELLVRVRAAALNPKDVLLRAGKFPILSGLRFPKRLGYDFAGEVVEAAGKTGPRVGDAVYGMIQPSRGGALAEYVTIAATQLALKPEATTWQEAAALPLTSLTALQALRDDGGLVAGQRVLIHGASGGVGVSAVQIAKALGAQVTATSSARNQELVRSLGADHWLDYQSENIFQGGPYHLIFDAFGNQTFSRARLGLHTHGRYVSTVPSVQLLRDVVLSGMRAQRAKLVVVRSNTRDLELLAQWVQQRKLRAVIDSTYTLAESVAAQQRVQSKRARGKVIIEVA